MGEEVGRELICVGDVDVGYRYDLFWIGGGVQRVYVGTGMIL